MTDDGKPDLTVIGGRVTSEREEERKFVPRKTRLRAREEEALALHIAGIPLSVISERLGVSDTQAYRDYRKAFERRKVRPEAVDEWRETMLARYERLLAATWAKAVGGDLQAIQTADRLLVSVRRMLGLDAPKQLEMQANLNVTERKSVEVVARVESFVALVADVAARSQPERAGSNGLAGGGEAVADDPLLSPRSNGQPQANGLPA